MKDMKERRYNISKVIGVILTGAVKNLSVQAVWSYDNQINVGNYR